MLLNLEGFLADVKRAALEAVIAAKPFSFTYGTVVSVTPLQIMVDQKLTLQANQLILTNAVRNYSVDMTVDQTTDDPSSVGKKRFTVHLALKKGDKVLLFRADGGQKYIVLDRAEVPV